MGTLSARTHRPGSRRSECRSKCAAKHLDKGFTLIELLATLAIAAVLLGFALPAFNGLIEQNSMTSQVNSLVQAISYARSEAIRSGGVVSVQSVDDSAGDNEWGAGFCVVAGNPGDCSGTVLRRFEALDGVTFDAVGGFDGIGTLSFNARGLMIGTVAGSLQLCGPNSESDPGRALNVNLTGRASAQEFTCH